MGVANLSDAMTKELGWVLHPKQVYLILVFHQPYYATDAGIMTLSLGEDVDENE